MENVQFDAKMVKLRLELERGEKEHRRNRNKTRVCHRFRSCQLSWKHIEKKIDLQNRKENIPNGKSNKKENIHCQSYLTVKYPSRQGSVVLCVALATLRLKLNTVGRIISKYLIRF